MTWTGEGKMDEATDLKALEKKAWTSYFQDGLWEIVFGTILLASALSCALESAGVADATRTAIYFPLIVALPPLIITLGKWYITLPRMGFVKFGERRMRNQIKMMAAIAATLSVNLVMWGLSTIYPEATRGPYGLLLVTFDVLAIFCLIGYYMDYRGFYLMAVLMAIPYPVKYLLEHYTAIVPNDTLSYGIPAIILLAVGLSALFQFMRKYDVPKEVPDAS